MEADRAPAQDDPRAGVADRGARTGPAGLEVRAAVVAVIGVARVAVAARAARATRALLRNEVEGGLLLLGPNPAHDRGRLGLAEVALADEDRLDGERLALLLQLASDPNALLGLGPADEALGDLKIRELQNRTRYQFASGN